MERKNHYGTVTEALQAFKDQGFIVDFNLEENLIKHGKGKFNADDFEIIDVYRYEGDTDPADEAVVYAIQSKSGIKGVLVAGYGMSSDSITTEIIKKLH